MENLALGGDSRESFSSIVAFVICWMGSGNVSSMVPVFIDARLRAGTGRESLLLLGRSTSGEGAPPMPPTQGRYHNECYYHPMP
jgi:hypothetical protein